MRRSEEPSDSQQRPFKKHKMLSLGLVLGPQAQVVLHRGSGRLTSRKPTLQLPLERTHFLKRHF